MNRNHILVYSLRAAVIICCIIAGIILQVRPGIFEDQNFFSILFFAYAAYRGIRLIFDLRNLRKDKE